MTANSTQRAAELSALLARHSSLPPAQIAAHVLHLQRIAKQLKAIATRQANGYRKAVPETHWGAGSEVWDQEAADRDEKREQKLAERATAIASAMVPAIRVAAGGDPRGPCLSLLIAGERGDGWGDGYAVY